MFEVSDILEGCKLSKLKKWNNDDLQRNINFAELSTIYLDKILANNLLIFAGLLYTYTYIGLQNKFIVLMYCFYPHTFLIL